MTTLPKLYGLYAGSVSSDARPTGPLLIVIPAATGTRPIAAVSAPLIGYDAVAALPIWIANGLTPGTPVWVMFQQGDTSHPVVLGLK